MYELFCNLIENERKFLKQFMNIIFIKLFWILIYM